MHNSSHATSDEVEHRSYSAQYWICQSNESLYPSYSRTVSSRMAASSAALASGVTRQCRSAPRAK